jgi:uncharacterized membrane-anchored protein
MKKITVGLIALLTSLNLFAAGNDAALERAWETADKAATRGPATVDIAGQASLTVPKGFEFIPKAQADALMKAMGVIPPFLTTLQKRIKKIENIVKT